MSDPTEPAPPPQGGAEWPAPQPPDGAMPLQQPYQAQQPYGTQPPYQPPYGATPPPFPAQEPYPPQQPYAGQPYPTDPTGAFAPGGVGQPGGQQFYGQPPVDWSMPAPDGAAAPAPAPAPKSRLPLVIAVVVAVVAIVAGGLVFAGSRGWFTASGASSPNAAVEDMFQSVSNGDLLGVVDKLAPSEAQFSADMTGDFTTELKRLGIITEATTSDQLYSAKVTVAGLTLAPDPVVINDHVEIVRVTGGTVTLDSDGAQSALAPKILDALPPEARAATHESVDFATDMADTGNALRIATVKVDGHWYPSLVYSVADNIAYTQVGPDYASKLKPIAPVGAASPEAAMGGLVAALTSGDANKLIATLDPATMGAVQEYASLGFANPSDRCLFGADGSACKPAPFTVQKATWTTSAVTGGTKVSLGTLTLETPDGAVTLTRDPAVPSLTIAAEGEKPTTVSPKDVSDLFDELTHSFGVDLTAESQQIESILSRELDQLLGIGVVMTQSTGGQWFVSPLNTYSDVVLSLLKGLQPADIDFFLQQAHR